MSDRTGRAEKLFGNIAPEGVRVYSVPEGMTCFRGQIRVFGSAGRAAEAVRNGSVAAGQALVIMPAEPDPCGKEAAGSFAELERALCEAGIAGRVTVLADEAPGFAPGTAAVFCYNGREDMLSQHAGLIADGDSLEYDAETGIINADMTEEGFSHRLEGGDPDDIIVTELDEGTWVLTERYSRCFLLKGRRGNLLIDTAFGRTDIRRIAEDLAGGPVQAVLTHGHWDHVSGLSRFSEARLNRKDWDMLPEPLEIFDDRAVTKGCTVRDLEDGTVFDPGGREIEAIACPGHTQGGMAFLDRSRGILFAGDSVAVGPTYLFYPHCSPEKMAESLRKLLGRADEFGPVLSSHRKMRLDKSYIEEMLGCVEGALSGIIKGKSACVSRSFGICEKYSFGRVSAFMARDACAACAEHK